MIKHGYSLATLASRAEVHCRMSAASGTPPSLSCFTPTSYGFLFREQRCSPRRIGLRRESPQIISPRMKTSSRWSAVTLTVWMAGAFQGCSSTSESPKRDGGFSDAFVAPAVDVGGTPDIAADGPMVTAMDTSVPDSSAAEAMGLDLASQNGPSDGSSSLDGVSKDVGPVDTPIDTRLLADAAVDRPAQDSVVETTTDSGGVTGQDGGVDTGPVSCGTGGFVGTPGSLLSNGGFECPVVAKGGFADYSVGQQFFGWTVVGANGHVSPLSGAYVNGVYTWPAHGGAQALDLTGDSSNSATGVEQPITTVPGTTYHLSFWVGNLDAPNTLWGTTSTVNVLINGVQALAATNDQGAGSTAIVWKQFTLDFTASASSTTIAFMNGDSSNDNSNLLDDVTLD